MDTSVWSLALRRNSPLAAPEVEHLRNALAGGDAIHSAGIVLQELLQGYQGPRAKVEIIERFAVLPMVEPVRDDYIAAAELRNECRRHGIQVGTIDALLAQLCIRHDLIMLSADRDFSQIADHAPLRLWRHS